MSYSKIAIGADEAQSGVLAVINEPVVKTGVAVALTYHGYKRTGSILWALIYGALGRIAPLTSGVIAVAQGFGQRKGS